MRFRFARVHVRVLVAVVGVFASTPASASLAAGEEASAVELAAPVPAEVAGSLRASFAATPAEVAGSLRASFAATPAEVAGPLRASFAATPADSITIETYSVALSEEQSAEVTKRIDSGRPVQTVTEYRVYRAGSLLGFGYVDTHRVRTLSESLLVVLDLSGQVREVVVLAFAEPKDYLPHARWYEQFGNLAVGKGLKYGREIDAVTGATLTGRSTVNAVVRTVRLREWLAQHGRSEEE